MVFLLYDVPLATHPAEIDPENPKFFSHLNVANVVSVGTAAGQYVVSVWGGSQIVRETYNTVNANLQHRPSGESFTP
jgi:hypothetical protein